MPANTDEIQDGMEVVGLGGDHLGTVSRIWPDVDRPDVIETTPDSEGIGAQGMTTDDVEAARILEQVEARGTTAGDVGANYASAGGYGPDQPGHSPGHGPEELSPVGLGIQGYIQVDGAGGLLGIGATHLYVPFSAVKNVVEARVILEVDAGQAKSLYGNKPVFLD
ncbi:MAG: hypothetical protein ACRDFS_05770 [Chloroflexota bacterium]